MLKLKRVEFAHKFKIFFEDERNNNASISKDTALFRNRFIILVP